MKITKKITSIVLALLLAVSAFAGLAITASAVDVPTSAKLTIHKYDLDDTTANQSKIGNTSSLTGTTADGSGVSGKPLAGVQFTIYYQGGLGTAVPETPDTTTARKATKTTGADGTAVFTIDGTTLPVGLYYVVETSSPAKVTRPADPFYVSLPMTSQNVGVSSMQGEYWNSDVHVYPKNLTTLGGAVLTKTINNAPITSTTTLAVPPKFKLVEYKGTEVGTAIATSIEAKAGYNAVTKATDLDAKYDTVVIAQKDGKIAVDGLPVGTYAFIETDAAQVEEGKNLPVDSTPRVFTVSQGNNVDVTTTDSGFGTIAKITAGDNGTYSFTMDNSSEPTVSKAVNKTSAQIGENVTWTIVPIIPADIATYKKYTVTDQIVNQLDISGVDAVTVTATGATLTKDIDYTITVVNKLVTVDFTTTGRQALANATNLEIAIVTQINSSAEADQAIKNKAELEYKNSFQTTSTKVPSNEPETTTGAFKIEKVDKANHNTKLDGVEFTLSDAQGKALTVTGTAGNYTICKAGTEGATSTVITDANGVIYVKGLAYGDNAYKLTETKTKNGYQLLTAPVDITVANGTGNTPVTVENVKQPELPLTGGMGTILFTVAGLALIGGSAFFFIRSRKSRKEEI